MKKCISLKQLQRKITEEIIREIIPDHAARDRKFTKAAHRCGLSRGQLTRIYMAHWFGIDRAQFADMILRGRLVYCKEAHGDFHGAGPHDHSWYSGKDGKIHYWRGELKGQVR